jgi:transcriptional regulator GlxA family with amidase domain
MFPAPTGFKLTGMIIGILLFDGVEELDFCGPLEVFSGAKKAGADLDVFTLASKSPVTCAAGLVVLPRYMLAEAPALDLLVVPGGPGTRVAVRDAAAVEFIRREGTSARKPMPRIASVCTGALLLGAAGLLEGKRCTTHHAALALLREEVPGAQVESGVRYIRDGDLWTGAGVVSGIDLALALVEEFFSAELAGQVAANIEFTYPY